MPAQLGGGRAPDRDRTVSSANAAASAVADHANVATQPIRLTTGAEMRVTGPGARPTVVCVNGGQAARVPGTWSASLEWLVRHLAPLFPAVAFSEVRYRVKSWHALDLCEEDTRAAVEAAGGSRTLLVGFSMGGAVAVRSADAPSVEGVLGLAPWLPDRLELDSLEGKRLDVLHGSLDRPLPGIPGVRPSSSRTGFDRAKRLGVEGTYRLVPGALHGIAIRARSGVLPLPGARRWAALVAERIDGWVAV
jgi:pimeloyl-ACP methyl ester carboxylesterase